MLKKFPGQGLREYNIRDFGAGGVGGELCFEWGFTRTFPGNQDVAVK